MVAIIVLIQTVCIKQITDKGKLKMHQSNVNGTAINKCRACDSRGGCVGESLGLSAFFGQDQISTRHINRKGDHVYHEGDQSDAFFIVRSGSVKSYLVTEDGEEQVLGFFLPGDVFGLDTCESGRHVSSAVILETSSLCRIPIEHATSHTASLDLLKLASEQVVHTHNLVLMLAKKDADGRIASLLLSLAARFQRRGYSASEFSLSMSRQDIGCYLGLAVETVSRTLTRFQDSGILQVNRRQVSIVDKDSLQKIAGSQIQIENYTDGVVVNQAALA